MSTHSPIYITPETISKALSEYLRVHHDRIVLKVEWLIDTDMTDQPEPRPHSVFRGANIETT